MTIRVGRALMFAATTFVLIGSASIAQAKVPVNDDRGSDRLPTGHCLAAGAKEPFVELRTRSERFEVDLFPSQLDIKNHVTTPRGGGAGYPVRSLVPKHGRGHRSTLCMQSNGALVMRVDGKTAWSTRTAGTGRHNYARILETGQLVVRTSSNRTVYSSGTTAVLLRVGDRLDSGKALVNRTYPGGHTKLEMRRSGDLVLSRGTHRVWHTDTHRRGSVLYIASTGRLTIRTPDHRTVWRSPAVGRNAVVTVAQKGRITLSDIYHSSRCWVRPAHSGGCGVG